MKPIKIGGKNKVILLNKKVIHYKKLLLKCYIFKPCNTSKELLIINIRTSTFKGTSWDIAPDGTTSLIIAGTYVSSVNLAGCDCTVNSGINMTINTNHTLSLNDKITNSGGTITFENGASLVQTNGTSNTGNVLYKRNTTIMNNNYDFTYWGSPVGSQNLGGIWSLSIQMILFIAGMQQEEQQDFGHRGLQPTL